VLRENADLDLVKRDKTLIEENLLGVECSWLQDRIAAECETALEARNALDQTSRGGLLGALAKNNILTNFHLLQLHDIEWSDAVRCGARHFGLLPFLGGGVIVDWRIFVVGRADISAITTAFKTCFHAAIKYRELRAMYR
jgi:hypothetical protein